MITENCPHCDPYPADVRHRAQRLEQLFDPFTRALFALEDRASRLAVIRILRGFFLYGLFHFFILCRVFREEVILEDDPRFFHRTTCLVSEARARGIEIKALTLFGQPKNFFMWRRGRRRGIFECLPCYDLNSRLAIDVDDKEKFRCLLASAGLPTPEGRAFRDPKHALWYAERIGFPLVVKPCAGSLSQHVTCDIRDRDTFEEAVCIAKMVSSVFVVERFIQGDVYRATLVDGKLIAMCRREPPNVVGNGVSSVRELVARKNADPRRGEVWEKHRTLHRISLTDASVRLLAQQGIGVDDVPVSGRKIYLHSKVILACGVDIHDCTGEVHPKTRDLLERAAVLCQAPVIGFDFICEDITKPYHAQSFAIIEANTLPYIDMHHVPVTGEPRNVAGAIVDLVCGRIDTR